MLNLRINGVYNSCVILPHCGGAHAPAQCAWVKCAITNPIRVKREYCRSETFGEQTACSCGEERRESSRLRRQSERTLLLRSKKARYRHRGNVNSSPSLKEHIETISYDGHRSRRLCSPSCDGCRLVFDPPWHSGLMSDAAKLQLGFGGTTQASPPIIEKKSDCSQIAGKGPHSGAGPETFAHTVTKSPESRFALA